MVIPLCGEKGQYMYMHTYKLIILIIIIYNETRVGVLSRLNLAGPRLRSQNGDHPL
jgi:hypothetical protein